MGRGKVGVGAVLGRVRRASGTLITIEGLVNDITEKQKNELGIRRENEELRARLKARCFNNIVGDSPPMREVFESSLAPGATEDCVVVFGESGTGKEWPPVPCTNAAPAATSRSLR